MVFGSVSAVNGRLEAQWASTPGQVFRLQYADDLASDQWLDWGEPIRATGAMSSVQVEISPTGQRFFRIVLIP